MGTFLPEHLRGDGPCQDCGTLDNIVWFTENVLWNRVTGETVYAEEERGAILCIPCFIMRADRAGLHPTGWRVLAEWPWREKAATDKRGRPTYFYDLDLERRKVAARLQRYVG